MLAAPLDVIVVRKLGVPGQPELATGAIGEGDVAFIDWVVVSAAGKPPYVLPALSAQSGSSSQRL